MARNRLRFTLAAFVGALGCVLAQPLLGGALQSGEATWVVLPGSAKWRRGIAEPGGSPETASVRLPDGQVVPVRFEMLLPGASWAAAPEAPWVEGSAALLQRLRAISENLPPIEGARRKYAFGVLSVAKRRHHLKRKVTELVSIALKLQLDATVLVVYDGLEVDEAAEDVCRGVAAALRAENLGGQCQEFAVLLPLEEPWPGGRDLGEALDLSTLGLKYEVRDLASGALGVTHVLAADDDDLWSAPLVQRWIEAHEHALQQYGVEVRVHASPELTVVVAPYEKAWWVYATDTLPKYGSLGNPGVGLIPLRSGSPLRHVALGLKSWYGNRLGVAMCDSPDLEVLTVTALLEVATPTVVIPSGRDMLVYIHVLGKDGGTANAWNGQIFQWNAHLTALSYDGVQAVLRNGPPSWGDTLTHDSDEHEAHDSEQLDAPGVRAMLKRGRALTQSVFGSAIRSVWAANAYRARYAPEFLATGGIPWQCPDTECAQCNPAGGILFDVDTANSPQCQLWDALHGDKAVPFDDRKHVNGGFSNNDIKLMHAGRQDLHPWFSFSSLLKVQVV
jgi:hypothetical protein